MSVLPKSCGIELEICSSQKRHFPIQFSMYLSRKQTFFSLFVTWKCFKYLEKKRFKKLFSVRHSRFSRFFVHQKRAQIGRRAKWCTREKPGRKTFLPACVNIFWNCIENIFFQLEIFFPNLFARKIWLKKLLKFFSPFFKDKITAYNHFNVWSNNNARLRRVKKKTAAFCLSLQAWKSRNQSVPKNMVCEPRTKGFFALVWVAVLV